ncbi:MAG TPA: hypothetical protein H9903_14310 [Candidatus Aquabacterium excrementipullorum]|nr:hypothetical protein [Candidatus Aquabacterium excrementipullorum]
MMWVFGGEKIAFRWRCIKHTSLPVALIPVFFGCLPVNVSASENPFFHGLLGRCFANFAEAMRVAVGQDSEQDENFSILEESVLPKWKWIVDKTSGHNYQWYLVEPRKSGAEQCIALYIPFASTVKVERTNVGTALIKARTQASPGGDAFIMKFRRSAKLERFVPVACIRERFAGSGRRVKQEPVDCLQVGE